MAAAGGEVPGEWPRAASGSCTLMKVVEEPLQLLRLLFMSGKASFPWRNSSSNSQTSCTPLFSAPVKISWSCFISK